MLEYVHLQVTTTWLRVLMDCDRSSCRSLVDGCGDLNVLKAVQLEQFAQPVKLPLFQSVWLCSRNDAIGNVAVIFAAIGVFGTGSLWPDIIVAGIMATLGMTAGYQVVSKALSERRLQLEN